MVDENAFPRDSQELNPVFPSGAMLQYSIQCSWQLSRILTTTDNKNQVFICLYLKVNSECDLGLRIICAGAKTFVFCPFHPWNVADGKWDMMAKTWRFPNPDLGWNPACLLTVLCLWHVV